MRGLVSQGAVDLGHEASRRRRDHLPRLHAEEAEKKEHPLSRIMSIDTKPEGLVISTTDTHLPRRIGEGLKHAYHGELELHYNRDEDFVRVTWTR